MERSKAIENLIIYNAWRRGAEIKQPDPYIIGLSIDKAIEVMESDQTPTDVLTTEIMVIRERNEELVEMLERAKSTIAVLKRSMLVHPDCELGSEFCDRTTDAQNLEDEIGKLFNKVTNGN